MRAKRPTRTPTLVTAVLVGLASSAALTVAYVPEASAKVVASCVVDVYRQSGRIECGPVSGGSARARIVCPFAPDVYTNWVKSFQSSTSGRCLTYATGAEIEVRNY